MPSSDLARDCGALFGNDLSIAQNDPARGVHSERRVVRDKHERCAFRTVELEQEIEHVLAVRRVEIPCGLIGEHNWGPQHEGAGERDSLLLAARELHWVVVEAFAQANRGEELSRAIKSFATAASRGVELIRQQHILKRRQCGNELIALKDEPDGPAAELREFILRQITDRGSLPSHITGAWIIEPREQAKECRFARTGRAHDGNEFATRDSEVQSTQNVDRCGPGTKTFA